MQRILLARWSFYIGLLTCVVCGGLGWVNHWDTGQNTISGYDPVPALYLLPLAIILFSYAVGGPLARRGRVSGVVVERWLFLVGIGGFVATYAAALLVGTQFNPTTGVSYDTSALTGPLTFVFVALVLSALFGREPAVPEPTPKPGPGGVAMIAPQQVAARAPVLVPAIGRVAARRLDHLVLAAAIVSLAVIFAFWTGFSPAVYGPPSAHWTLADIVCGPGANNRTVPYVEPTFPLWATVRFAWSANMPVLVMTWGPGGPFYNGLGTSGNFSFISNAQSFALGAVPNGVGPCTNMTVQITASYSV